MAPTVDLHKSLLQTFISLPSCRLTFPLFGVNFYKIPGGCTLHHHVGEALHVRRNNVRLMRGVAERQLATVDECRMHARGLGPDTIEGVASDEEDFVHSYAHDLGGLGVCCYVGFERVSDSNRDHGVERNLMEGLGCLEHIGIAV